MALCLWSCEDFIEVDTPNYLIGNDVLFTDAKTVEAAMISIYAKMRDDILLTGDAQGLSTLLGQYADEFDFYSPYGLLEEQFNKNALLAANSSVAQIWEGSYSQIYAANAILEGVKDSPYFSPEEIAQFSGESLFIRGLVHFYLVNLYGDVPYIKTTNHILNQKASRDKVVDVYQQIIEDLETARTLLPANESSGEKVRPDQKTATALLARVYLYSQNWEKAAEMASLVIENTAWENNPENVFLKESPSILWQLQPEFEGRNTLEAENFIFYTAPPPTRALTPSLVDAFEPGDLRKEYWIGTVTDGTQSWYFPFKYKHQAGESTNAEYSIIMRLAEQYLIRAEARVHIGDLSGAQSDLNLIRTRAGLEPINATASDELLSAIMQERRIELFTEHGHRFFDLKRTGSIDNVLPIIKPGWNGDDILFPIPQKDLLLNPNLQPQNPGY
ncbi:MAG: RagB/SusD family nutrient uptake outer membrane protein [Aequorivita antarctica]